MKSNKFTIIALCAFLAVILLLLSCEDKVQFANTIPSSLTLIPSKCFVETGGTIILYAGAVDDDGDSLTFSWKAPKGRFFSASSNGDVIWWEAPDDPGTVPITVTVTDELARVSKTQNIGVCILFPSSITSSTTIVNTGSPYILKEVTPLRIPSVATLTIEAGVTIVMDSNIGGFEVYGHIVANGTPEQKILFRGNTCGSTTGMWGGIGLNEELCAASFTNTEITQSKDGIILNDMASLTAENCAVYNNSGKGIWVLNGSRAEIRSCSVWENGTGIAAEDGYAYIRLSSIMYNYGSGIEISCSVDTIDSVIDSCTVANNRDSGIVLIDRAAPPIHYCSIYANGESSTVGHAIVLSSYTAEDTVHAENNFWGTGNTTSQKISALIFDAHDWPISAYVGFTPWLSSSPVTTAFMRERGF